MKLGRKRFNWKDKSALCILGISMLLFTASIVYAYSYTGAYWNSASTGYDYSGLAPLWASVASYAQGTWNSSGMAFTVVYDWADEN